MKLRFLCLVLISLMATTTFAATIGAWIQDPCGCTLSGNWTEARMWKTSSNNRPPTPTTNTGDEIKLNTPTGGTIVNTDLPNYNCKLTIAAGMNDIDKERLYIQTGAVIDMGQVQIGHGSSTDKGQWGAAYQTGGTVKAEKLIVGYFGTRGKAHGEYIISGGTLQGNSGMTGNTDRLLIGAGMTSGTGSTNPASSEGIFTIVGADATISMKELYVGGYGTFVGTGTVNFKIKSAGVSQITVSNAITLPAAGVANLNVTMCESYLGEDIILVENTGTSSVGGVFDLINGVNAIEGAQITLGKCAVYTLTYVYDASTGAHIGGNDIALIPEPATIALLSLGLLAIRRKK